MKVVAGIVSALVLSNLALAVMMLQRQDDASERLALLEKTVEKGRKNVDDLASRQEGSERRIDQIAESRREAAAPAAAHVPASAPAVASRPAAPEAFRSADPASPSATPLNEAQNEAVKRAVDEAVKKKLGHMPDLETLNDPMGTMEKELELSSWQKERIKGIMDQLELDKQKLLQEAMDPNAPEKFNFSKLGDIMALQKKYDELIRGELDPNQQAKYAELKKQNKLPLLGGGNIRFAVNSSRSDEPK